MKCFTKHSKNEQQPIYKSTKTIQINDNDIEEITTSTLKLNENNLTHPTTTTTTKSILNPVDLPKNFSANNTININLNSFNHMEKQLITQNQQNPKTLTTWLNTSDNTKTTTNINKNDRKNIPKAERCNAINLNSFTDIIQKTTATATINNVDDDDNHYNKQQQQIPEQRQNNTDSIEFVETSKDSTLGSSNYNLLTAQQPYNPQQQQQQHHRNHSLYPDMDSIVITKRCRISSPPPLDGRDVELNMNTSNSSTTISTINPTLNCTKTKRTSSHLQRFELEI